MNSPTVRCPRRVLPIVLSLALAGCGGGGDSGGGAPNTGGSPPTAGTGAAATLAARMGRPNRLMVGLGGGVAPSTMQAQGLTPDIHERYLVGAGGSYDWPSWNSPAGAYVNVVAAEADSVGAVPMFTLYQMASNGDGNLAGLSSTTFMSAYWANVVLMFQRLAIYDKPALVNFEPDFWGYVERQATNSDPTKLFAYVNITPDCASLPNDATGLAACLVRIARKYAPKAVVGFSPSGWGGNSTAEVVSFMNKLGAAQADIVVMQTSDRDAGCFEAHTDADCQRSGSGWYWDESNQTHPNFQDHLQEALAYHQGIGGLPLVWWQTPMGVPAASYGSANHWRDNREHYFLTHASELTAVGGLGIVFGPGAGTQTSVTTDGGQYQTLSKAYLASPAALP